MAHWAEINERGVVLRVTVGDNNDPNGDEGYQWLIENLGGTWIKASYNATIGKKYPAEGDTYDAERNAFIPPQPFPSWSLNEDTCLWDAPVLRPTDGLDYIWDEATTAWVPVTDATP